MKKEEILNQGNIRKTSDFIDNNKKTPANSLPKRHLSITPISSQYNHIKSKIFNSNYVTLKSAKNEKTQIKSENNIPLQASILPNIRTSLQIQKNEYSSKKDKELIKPNNKVIFSIFFNNNIYLKSV